MYYMCSYVCFWIPVFLHSEFSGLLCDIRTSSEQVHPPFVFTLMIIIKFITEVRTRSSKYTPQSRRFRSVIETASAFFIYSLHLQALSGPRRVLGSR